MWEAWRNSILRSLHPWLISAVMSSEQTTWYVFSSSFIWRRQAVSWRWALWPAPTWHYSDLVSRFSADWACWTDSRVSVKKSVHKKRKRSNKRKQKQTRSSELWWTGWSVSRLSGDVCEGQCEDQPWPHPPVWSVWAAEASCTRTSPSSSSRRDPSPSASLSAPWSTCNRHIFIFPICQDSQEHMKTGPSWLSGFHTLNI